MAGLRRFFTVPVLFALCLALLAVLAACKSTGTSGTAAPPNAAIPAGVDLGGKAAAAVSATEAASVTTGLAVLGSTTVSAGRAVSVVSWLASPSEHLQLVHAAKFWDIAGVQVSDESGHAIFRPRPSDAPMIRGGGPVSVQIGAGRVHQQDVTFRLARPGRYRVSAVSAFQLASQPPPGVQPFDFVDVSVATPPIDLTVR